MRVSETENTRLLSKCEDLVTRLRARLTSIDRETFPSTPTADAVDTLEANLRRIEETVESYRADTDVLFQKLILCETLIGEIGVSVSSRIAWPLVAYCDDNWDKMFRDAPQEERPKVFYTISPEHNYWLEDFGEELKHTFTGTLHEKEIDESIGLRRIWHLHLPKLEGDNIPLFACVPHEFGHALYDHRKRELEPAYHAAFSTMQPRLGRAFRGQVDSANLKDLLDQILERFCCELFDDAVATVLAGPAFPIALTEMQWGDDPDEWTVELPRLEAHPSLSFRLSVIREETDLEAFEKALDSKAKQVTPELRSAFSDVTRNLPKYDLGRTSYAVTPSKHVRAAIVTRVLEGNKTEIAASCRRFARSCYESVRKTYLPQAPPLRGSEVADLIGRIYHGLPPNIVPTRHYLGDPANLDTILTAAGLYRLSLLGKNLDVLDPKRGTLHQQLSRLDRLTLKALEVSYVQRTFRDAFPGRAANADT